MYIRIDVEDETAEYIEDYKTAKDVIDDATRYYHEHFTQDEDYDEDFEVKTFEQAKDFWSANGYNIKELSNKDYVCPVCDSENVECMGSEISGLLLSYHYFCQNCKASYDRDYNLVFNGYSDITKSIT